MNELIEFENETALHILTTRFNIVWKAGPVTDTKWMNHRMELFERFCVPSVREQSSKKFHWLILIREGTPQKNKHQIENLVSGCPFPVKILETPTTGDVWSIHDKVVNGYLENIDVDWIIASRVDNDDALGIDYIAKMQQSFSAQEKVVRAKRGYKVMANDPATLAEITDPYAPFFTVHSRKGSRILTGGNASYLNNRCGGSHPKALIPGTTFKLDFLVEPLWVVVIHGKNVGNVWKNPRGVIAPTVSVENLDGFFEPERWVE